ncbi:MAG: 2-succinyl-5-enolpyruvyl-6-hydroxy-3-cyclohexene-1-carboxylic-acid synthase [Myxococcota bacterium]
MTTGKLKTLPTVPARRDPAASSAPSPAAVQTAWARLFMASLRRAGVCDAIISPGSRSTPWVLAAEHAGLRTHTVIDERSAGFFALGQARMTAVPPLLLCTSGSAGAHYYPAIIEAAQSFVPLLVMTADRPSELHGCAAPQTIDQTRLFGDFVRQFCDLGPAESSAAAMHALARKAVQAVVMAGGPRPGPVHINAPARKPLEPAAPGSAVDIAVTQRGDEIAAGLVTQIVAAEARVSESAIARLARACAAAQRGLLVAGPMPRRPPADSRALAMAARDLARAAGFPILAENAYRRSVQDVAAAHGLVWIDAERALAAHPDWFFDYCHFDARGHRRVAQLLERELRQRRLLL